jgi:hypothetical protein
MPPTPTPNASKLTRATPRKTRGFRFVRPYRQRGSTCSSGIGVHGRQSRRYRGGYGQYTPSSARGERQRVNREVPVSVPASVATSGAVGRGVPSPPPPMAVSSSAGQTSSTTARKTIARKTIARKTIARKTIARKTIFGMIGDKLLGCHRHSQQRRGQHRVGGVAAPSYRLSLKERTPKASVGLRVDGMRAPLMGRYWETVICRKN